MFRLRMERFMLQGFTNLAPFFHNLSGFPGEIATIECFPQIVHCHRGWMKHIVGIKTIIAQLIHEDENCRK